MCWSSRWVWPYTSETIAAASGIHPWIEWARIELATPERPYTLPPIRHDYGGVAVSLARQEYPCTSTYTDPEIVYRVCKYALLDELVEHTISIFSPNSSQ